MFKFFYLITLLSIVVFTGCDQHDPVQSELEDQNELLDSLFFAYKEYNMRAYPTWATYEGDHRYNSLLTDVSEEAQMARTDSIRNFLGAINELVYDSLSAAKSLDFDLFKWSLERDLEGDQFKYHYQPIGQQSGIHIRFPQIINYQPVDSTALFNDYFSRLKGFETQVDNIIVNMRKGMDERLVPPQFIMEQVITQIDNIKNTPTDSIAFMLPLQNNNNVSKADFEELHRELASIIDSSLKPAYGMLGDFIADEYLPACRKEAGIWSLPDGKDRYEYAIKYYTTLPLTADEIFDIGTKEVERITTEMAKIKADVGFEGAMPAFFDFLRSDQQFYYTDKEEMMQGYRDILKVMDAQLSTLFGRLPEAPYELKEIEAYRAASAPQAYYYSAPEDRSRPGYFYVNTYDLTSRPKYTMTALALHEAVPGHHLQIAIAQELEGFPWFRANMSVTAFVEGWGLYAESLGYETGMYEDKYQHFGALTFEIWRACRLVVDVGIHHKKWTREQAVQYLLETTPNSELDIRSEVDRYISWPGQALAYKLGELKIKELRKKAETALADQFDIRGFHDLVLENGSIPLSLLEQNVSDWIQLQQQ